MAMSCGPSDSLLVRYALQIGEKEGARGPRFSSDSEAVLAVFFKINHGIAGPFSKEICMTTELNLVLS